MFVLVLGLFALANAKDGRRSTSNGKGREKRLFSIFNIVTFENAGCVTKSDSTMRGTCYSTSECASKGGIADGNCAAGFGVCCMFVVSTCGGAVNQNCTYIRNSEFPATAAASQTCKFSFNRICDGLCQIRLDFDNLKTADPPISGADLVGLCTSSGDTVIATSPTNASPPTVCGTLTGQHMYLETGNTGSAGDVTLTFGTGTGTRTYKIKVTYIECSNRSKAPEGCVQYFTGTSGTITSYNYPQQLLAGQQYASCIRQESGFCTVNFQETQGLTSDPFELYGTTADTPDAGALSDVGACNQNSVEVPLSTAISQTGPKICGAQFSNVDNSPVGTIVPSNVLPFQLTTFTDQTLGGSIATTNYQLDGYSLDFRQVAC